jgi:hypothetical protein
MWHLQKRVDRNLNEGARDAASAEVGLPHGGSDQTIKMAGDPGITGACSVTGGYRQPRRIRSPRPCHSMPGIQTATAHMIDDRAVKRRMCSTARLKGLPFQSIRSAGRAEGWDIQSCAHVSTCFGIPSVGKCTSLWMKATSHPEKRLRQGR